MSAKLPPWCVSGLRAGGESSATIALNRPEWESDVTAEADRARNHYLLNGGIKFVDMADVSAFMIVFTQIRGKDTAADIAAFLVEKDRPGWSVARVPEKMGTRAVHACELTFENCRIPVENRLAEEGGALETARGLHCVVTAARALGIAQGALDYSLKYTRERIQFGRPVSSFQGIRFMLADMATRIEAGRCLLYKACTQIDQGEDNGYIFASMAKCFIADTAMKAATDAVQLLGGYGYMKDHPVERMMRDAKLTQIDGGTKRIRYAGLARKALRL